MKKRRCKIIIDGSNFYFKLKNVGCAKLMNGDLSGFLESLLLPSDKLVGITYYVGQIKVDQTTKSVKLHAQQKKMLAKLRRDGINVSLGYLLKNNGKYHEKGVDVKMAMDIVVAAYEKQCDQIILISSDTDLLPAIEIAKNKKMAVRYIGFKHKPSFALKARASSYKLLREDDIKAFLPK
ncbi:NYN domain-containing protein [Microgenomates group bacterium]|nr:NYN domain-containing protein [Microgenomates group bacterium]